MEMGNLVGETEFREDYELDFGYGDSEIPKVKVAHRQLDSRSGVLRRDPEAWTRIKPGAQSGRPGFTVRWILKRNVVKGRTELSMAPSGCL